MASASRTIGIAPASAATLTAKLREGNERAPCPSAMPRVTRRSRPTWSRNRLSVATDASAEARTEAYDIGATRKTAMQQPFAPSHRGMTSRERSLLEPTLADRVEIGHRRNRHDQTTGAAQEMQCYSRSHDLMNNTMGKRVARHRRGNRENE